jgi:hypothetical protein
MDAKSAVDEFLEAIRPAVTRLVQTASQAERERILAFLSVSAEQSSNISVDRAPKAPGSPQYGSVTKKVRAALSNLALAHPGGVDAAMVHGACSGLTILQVRTALKTLAKLGDAARAARGSYLPAQSSAQAETGAVAAPVPFNLTSQSVEAAHHGSKGNGVL